MSPVVAAVGAILWLSIIAMIAYHRGRRRGRVLLPAALVVELREHKLRCMGEPPARVALEIGLLCETDPTIIGETTAPAN